MNHKEALISVFDRMEAERLALLDSLRSIDPERLNRKPAPDAWSVAEVIRHLAVAEEAALRYMQKKMQYGGLRKAGISAGLKQRLLNFLISLPIRYKAPKVIETRADDTVTFHEATARWQKVREALGREYQDLDPEMVDLELFKHPAAGKMSALQGARFMRRHMNRHIQQIKKTLQQTA